MSLRPLVVAVVLLLFPQLLQAQTRGGASACVPGQEAACAPGELPFEEFITGPPENLGTSTVPPVSERPLDPNAGERIPVRRFLVEGVRPNPEARITPERVQASADAAFRQLAKGADVVELTVGQMVKVSDAVTTYYRNHGYIVAKAFLPVQDIGVDGVVKVQVLEGRVAEVVVDGNKHYSKGVLAKSSENLVGQAPTRGAVETAVLYAQDNPGVRLFGTFKPGAKTGDTNFVLQVLNEDRLEFSGGADNFGTKFTGQYRAQIGAGWNNPLGFGDELNFSALEAFSPTNDNFGSLSYRVPVGPPGLGVSASASRNAFSVTGGGLDILQLEGTIFDYSVGTDWRFERTRFLNSTAGIAFDHKESTLTAVSTLCITDDKYNMGTLDGSLDRVDTRFKGLDQISGSVRRGLSGTVGGCGSGGDAKFTAYQMRYNRLQALTETQTAVIRFRTQFTSDPLVPLEKFSPSGPDGVRAYPVGDYLRDKGYFASLEYRVQAPGFSQVGGPFGRAWGDLLQFWIFGDYANVQDINAASNELSGYGAAIQFGVPGRFTFLVQGAQPISGTRASDLKDGLRVYGQVSIKL